MFKIKAPKTITLRKTMKYAKEVFKKTEHLKHFPEYWKEILKTLFKKGIVVYKPAPPDQHHLGLINTFFYEMEKFLKPHGLQNIVFFGMGVRIMMFLNQRDEKTGKNKPVSLANEAINSFLNNQEASNAPTH